MYWKVEFTCSDVSSFINSVSSITSSFDSSVHLSSIFARTYILQCIDMLLYYMYIHVVLHVRVRAYLTPYIQTYRQLKGYVTKRHRLTRRMQSSLSA